MQDFWKRNRSSKAQKRIKKISSLASIDFKALNILFNAYYDFDEDLIPWQEDNTIPDGFLVLRNDNRWIVQTYNNEINANRILGIFTRRI